MHQYLIQKGLLFKRSSRGLKLWCVSVYILPVVIVPSQVSPLVIRSCYDELAQCKKSPKQGAVCIQYLFVIYKSNGSDGAWSS